MKKTINVDFTTECSRPETAVKRFIAKYPECAHWEDELCYMFNNGTETECDKDAYGKNGHFRCMQSATKTSIILQLLNAYRIQQRKSSRSRKTYCIMKNAVAI